MHALASQGRLKDINSDVVHEFQRTSCSHALPVAGSAAGSAGVCERTLTNAVDYVTCRRSTADNTSWLKDHHQDDTMRTSEVLPPAPLQRLEQLESELVSLNHARRRLAVDDDGAGSSSSLNAARYRAVTGLATGFGSGQGDVDVDQSTDNDRNNYAVTSELNISPWISSFRDIAALQRRQMCGGSVLSTPADVVTSCLQPSYTHRTADDTDSSFARFTDSRLDDDCGGSPSKWRGSTLISSRTSTDDTGVDSRHEEGTSSFQRTPTKRELPSYPLDSAVEHPSTPVNGTSRVESHCILGMYCRDILTCAPAIMACSK